MFVHGPAHLLQLGFVAGADFLQLALHPGAQHFLFLAQLVGQLAQPRADRLAQGDGCGGGLLHLGEAVAERLAGGLGDLPAQGAVEPGHGAAQALAVLAHPAVDIFHLAGQPQQGAALSGGDGGGGDQQQGDRGDHDAGDQQPAGFERVGHAASARGASTTVCTVPAGSDRASACTCG